MPALVWILSVALLLPSLRAGDDWDGYGAWAFPSLDGRLRLTIWVEDERPRWRLEAVARDGPDEMRTALREGELEAPPVDAAVLTDGRVVLFERYGGEGRGALLTVLGRDGAVERVLDHRAVFGDEWDGLRDRRPYWRDFWVDELRGEIVLVDATNTLWAVDLETAAVETLAPPPGFDASLGWGHWTQRLFSMERALDAGWDGPARFAPAVLVASEQPLLWRIAAAACCARAGLALPEIREVFDLGIASERSVDRWSAWSDLAPAIGPVLIPEMVARLQTCDDRELEMLIEGLGAMGDEAAPDLVDALLAGPPDSTAEARLARALWAVQPADGPGTLPGDGAWIASVRRVRERLESRPELAAALSVEDLLALDPAALLLVCTARARRPRPEDAPLLSRVAARLAELPVPDPDDPRGPWLRLLEDRLARALRACRANGADPEAGAGGSDRGPGG